MSMNVEALSSQLVEKLQAAHAHLRSEMDKLGLSEQDGWWISEVVRELPGGTELVLRPLHLRLKAPDGLECVVWFQEKPLDVGAKCDSPENPWHEKRL